MEIPDSLLVHLADRYINECVDAVRYPFFKWAAVQAERMGYQF